MAQKIKAPYGSWKSPITGEMVAASSSLYYEPKTAADGAIFFLEMRPSEKGRFVIVRISPDGRVDDVIPAVYNARTRVHEYGGGSYAITKDGAAAYFSNFTDQRIYSTKIGRDEVTPITPPANIFYADYVLDEDNDAIICVQEDHSGAGEAVNSLVIMNSDGSGKKTLAKGNDFYSSPKLSPDGRQLAWLTWNHPLLPFFGTELWLADYNAEAKTLSSLRKIAGGENESIVEPLFSPDEVLYFVSDRSNWWNIYRVSDRGTRNVLSMEAEFSGPIWMLGLSSYSFISKDKIISTFAKDGFSYLGTIDLQSGKLQEYKIPLTEIRYVVANDRFAVFVAGSPSIPLGVYRFSFAGEKLEKIYPRESNLQVDTSLLSLPTAIQFPTEKNQTAHALYYPPKSESYEGEDGTLPPLMVISHGGPTGRCRTDLSLGINYWTSRGFAVIDVNYGGSTGYGRDYRMRLVGSWGVVDVDDCSNAAKYLARQKRVDGDRLIIRGGSAGGYTTLSALAFRKTFKAGASYYGISDLLIFAKDTHKFESRYLDLLVGPLPEKPDLYESRSALNYIDDISAPVIFFQGLEDKIVPPNQAEMMFDALKRKGIPTAYIAFEGEQHGFRQAKNIIRAYEAELYFYSKVFNFSLPDKVEPVKIENL